MKKGWRLQSSCCLFFSDEMHLGSSGFDMIVADTFLSCHFFTNERESLRHWDSSGLVTPR